MTTTQACKVADKRTVIRHRRNAATESPIVICALATLMSIFTSHNLAALSFEAEGSIRYSAIQEGKTNVIQVHQFVIYVTNALYSVRVMAPSKEVFDYCDIVHDGTNVYYLESYESTMAERRRRDPRIGPNSNIAMAYTARGPALRHGNSHDTGIIWLAVASGSYFSNRTNDMLDTAASIEFSGPIQGMIRLQKSRWTCQPESPHLPTEVVYFDDGTMPNGKPNLLPAYRMGFTSAVYRVTAFKKFSSMTFPSRSTFEIYFPKFDGKVNTDLRLAMLYDVTVDKVTFGKDRLVTLPVMPGPTYVTDERPSVGHRTFFPLNRWLSEEEAMARAVGSH